MKETKRKIIIFFLSPILLCSAIAFALELYLRYTAPYVINPQAKNLPAQIQHNPEFVVKYTSKGKRLIPNAHVIIKNHRLSNQDIRMDINSLGFRDKEMSEQKIENEVRILILGDSITWGDYLPAEKVYVEQIEKRLSNSFPQKKVEVINAGIGDAGLKEEIDLLIEQGLKTKPDLVLIAFYLNDSRPPWGFTGELNHRGIIRRTSLLAETAYKKIKLMNWIKKDGTDRFQWIKLQNILSWSNNKKDFLTLTESAKYDWGAAWNNESWVTIDKHLSKLKILSEQHNFKVGIIMFPVSYQVYSNFNENTPQITLKKKAQNLGFLFYDLLPTLKNHRTENIYFDICHPNEKGNAIIGEAISNFLIKEKLINTY
jgi:lysophospholipase L1-like esterase